VAAPRTLVALGRWASVAGSLKTIEATGKVPFSLEAILEKELGDKELFALLKLDSAIDGAVMMDPKSPPEKPEALAVVSLPLREMNGALAQASRAGKPVAMRPGVFRIGPGKDLVCDLAVSVGDAPARLLCGAHERDLDLLVPWMTRGLPKEPLGGADLHLELRAEGLRARYKDEISMIGPALPKLAREQLQQRGFSQPELIEMATAMATDAPRFIDDIDVLALDAKLDQGKSEASFSGTIRFKSRSSWATRFMTHRNEKAGSPPPLFWQLPKDSSGASFYRSADSEMFEQLRNALATAVRVAIPPGKLAPADARAIVELIARAPVNNARVLVTARGHLPTKAPERPIDPARFKPADAVRIALQKSNEIAGWQLLGVDAKADPYVAWLKDLIKLYGSRTLRNTLEKELKKKSEPGDKKPPVRETPWPSIRIVKAPRGVPEQAFVIEVRSVLSSLDAWDQVASLHNSRQHPKTGEVKVTSSAFVVVLQDGDHTWLASSPELETLGRILAAVRTGAPVDGTLGAREGLGALKSSTSTGGGFLVPKSIAHTFGLIFSDGLFEDTRRRVEKAITLSPNNAATPVLMLSSGEGGEAPSNTLNILLQKGSIDDFMTLTSLALRRRASKASDAAPPAPTP
jgi:hypothetical protein